MTNLSKERKRAEGKSVSAPVKSELSRQLCKICGIEPITFDYELAFRKVYPDFEQAENFVKLQKLLIEIGMGFDIQLFDYPTKLQIRFCWDDENFTFKIFGDSLEEVFLRFAIQICELDDEGDIKQAIRTEEWMYE